MAENSSSKAGETTQAYAIKKTAISARAGNKKIGRGYSIRDVMLRCSFTDSTFLLWFGRLPTRAESRMFEVMLTAQSMEVYGNSASMAARYIIASNPEQATAVAGGLLADRIGRSRVTIIAMAISGACALLIGILAEFSLLLAVGIALLWGIAVVADSAQFSALVSEHAPRDHVGTALTLQTSLGFLLTLITIEGMPRLAGAVGWRWAALLLVPGPLLGIAAMQQLTTADKSQTHRACEP